MDKPYTLCCLCSQLIKVPDSDDFYRDVVEAWDEHHRADECCAIPHDIDSCMCRRLEGSVTEAWINVYIDCGPIYGGAAEGGWHYRAIECWASIAIDGTFDPQAEGLCRVGEHVYELGEILRKHFDRLGGFGSDAIVRVELAKGDEILAHGRKPHYC